MNKIILIFSICVFNSSLFAKPIEPYRCIPTSNNGFILFNSKKFPNLDSIMYYPYLKPIKVKYVKKIAIPTDEGRRYILKQNYIEYIKGKPSGTYVIETQGALINGISYKNNKGSTLEFEPNYDMDYEIINNKLKKNNIFCE